jgi:RNA polymerase sigma factor (sigma-70 family)
MEWTALLQCEDLLGPPRAGSLVPGAAGPSPQPALPLTDDESFYEAWLFPLEERMLRCAWRVLRDPDLARDAVQDAMMTVWARRGRVQAHPNPDALALRICIDAALDVRRREQRARRAATAVFLDPAPLRQDEGPARIAERHERRARVLDAIERLPGKQAAAVLLRWVHEADYRTIAQALECSEITARIHVMRGRARLGRMLSDLAPAGADPRP